MPAPCPLAPLTSPLGTLGTLAPWHPATPSLHNGGAMAARKIESEIDRLYQLGPDEFTAARNTLAKTAGTDAAAIKRLTKPPIAAWAVNQVYWQHRDVYDALVTAAKELRQTHKAILAGRTGDLRSAGKAHEAAVDQAMKAALSTLAANGHPATDTTRQAIATTLRALPTDDPPGRLSTTLQPGRIRNAGRPLDWRRSERARVESPRPRRRRSHRRVPQRRPLDRNRCRTVPPQDHPHATRTESAGPEGGRAGPRGCRESGARTARSGAHREARRVRSRARAPGMPRKPRVSSSRRVRHSPQRSVRSRKRRPLPPKRSARKPPPSSAPKPPNVRSRKRRRRPEASAPVACSAVEPSAVRERLEAGS